MLFNSFRLTALLVLILSTSCLGQELYILNEPASSIPKGVFGVRAYGKSYKEMITTRSMYALRLMYGATPRLSIMATVSISNHHDRKLPTDLINHTHSGNQTTYYTQAIRRGVDYPYLFSGFHLYAKYRFLTIDKQNRHFRMAAYGEWSNVYVAHDEAEPTLGDDTSGFGAGLISTWLSNRFAISLTTGFIKPGSYSEMQRDWSGGPDLPTTIYYGDAIKYNLSFGYRLFPKKYESYEQSNWNVYVEFQGKSYEAATVIQNGTTLRARTAALQSGSFVEIYPGIQRIIKSNTRLEFCYGFQLLGYSYVHFTPVWTFAVQHYFYNRTKSKK